MNKKSAISLFILFSFISLSLSGCLQTTDNSPSVAFGIGLDNATALQQVAMYGEGQAQKISLSPNGRWMAVRSTIGVHLYDTQTWETLELNAPHQLISQMAFSPTGNLLALSIPVTNEIEVWQLPEAELVHRVVIPGGPSTLLGLIFTPSGDRLISSSFGAIHIWRMNDGELIQSFESPEEAGFLDVSLSGDGTFLAAVLVGSDINRIIAWRLEDQGSVTEYRISEGIRFDVGQFAPDGEQFGALASEGKKFFIWQSLNDANPLEIQSPSYIVNFAWVSNANGRMIVTGHTNGDVMLWESTTGKLLATLHPPDSGSVQLLQSNATGNRLAVVYDSGRIGLWSLPERRLEWMIEPVAGEMPTQIAIHADGARLLGVLPSGRMRIWNMQGGQEIELFDKLTTGQVLDLSFSPDGEWIAAGLENGLVSLWQSGAGESSKILLNQGARVDSVAFAPDTMRLATGVGGYINQFAYDDTVRVWDWMNGDILQEYAGEQQDVPGCSVFRNRVFFSPDGLLLASISHDFSVRVWDTKEMKLRETLLGHTQPVLDIAVSADGTTVASASLDGSIRLWRLQQGTERLVLMGDQLGMLAVALSSDGQTVAGASVTGVISVWDIASGRLLRTVEGNMNNFSMLAFSPDGSLIAAGMGDDLHLWSSQSGKLITTLPGENGTIVSVAFSSDGELLAYGSDTGLIYLWKKP